MAKRTIKGILSNFSLYDRLNIHPWKRKLIQRIEQMTRFLSGLTSQPHRFTCPWYYLAFRTKVGLERMPHLSAYKGKRITSTTQDLLESKSPLRTKPSDSLWYPKQKSASSRSLECLGLNDRLIIASSYCVAGMALSAVLNALPPLKGFWERINWLFRCWVFAE